MKKLIAPLAAATVAAAGLVAGGTASAASPPYDSTTLAGKVASLAATASPQVRFSALVEQEAADPSFDGPASPAITPTYVLSSPLDGTSVLAPDVTVNQDTAAAPQNETAIAVDPNHPNRLVAGANDYVTRTWTCDVSGTPCSALGDAYSGSYVSNDGGATWQGVATDPSHLGTLVPGVTHLTGGPYDAGGDPAVAFDSRGTAYYAGLGLIDVERPDLHQPDDGPDRPQRQGVGGSRRQRGQPLPRPGLRVVDALPVQPEQRQLHPVADLLRVVE